MKKMFIKKTYTPFVILYLVLYIILVTGFVFLAFKRQEFSLRNIVFLSGLTILFVPMLLLDMQGVYIKDDGVYYQTWRKCKIDIEQIVALRIIQAEAPITDTVYKPLKNAFSIIALSKIDETMKDYPYGDMRFVSKYKKNVIFQSIYDDKLIEYIKECAPDISIETI